MKKILGFLIPTALVLSGSVGMVVSGFATDSSIMPAALVDTNYSQADYDLAYEKSGEFKYRNAAVKDLSDALDTQLSGWKE